jgi:hypothetical protein
MSLRPAWRTLMRPYLNKIQTKGLGISIKKKPVLLIMLDKVRDFAVLIVEVIIKVAVFH